MGLYLLSRYYDLMIRLNALFIIRESLIYGFLFPDAEKVRPPLRPCPSPQATNRKRIYGSEVSPSARPAQYSLDFSSIEPMMEVVM